MDKQFFTDLRNNDAGLLENALPMVTGAVAEPVAGIAAMYHAATGGHDASGVVNAIRDAMTYQPRTDAGKMYQQALGSAVNRIVQSAPVKTWQKGVDIAGQYSPTAGAILQTVPAAIGAAAGVKPALRTGRAMSGALDRVESYAPRNRQYSESLGKQVGAILADNDLKKIADFNKMDDLYQFENSDQYHEAISNFVKNNVNNDLFEGMLLPTGHGQHNGYLSISPSAKKEGAWQVTHMDKDFMPISDEGVQTKAEALDSFARYSNPELWHK